MLPPALMMKAAKIHRAVTFSPVAEPNDPWMRYWLATNGVHPYQKMWDIKVIPPTQMAANKETKSMGCIRVGDSEPAHRVTAKKPRL
jgi:ABC-type nitrate/sulfonate/bicarbonate transport system substrate-binding protein